jgi:hypothetical protein
MELVPGRIGQVGKSSLFSHIIVFFVLCSLGYRPELAWIGTESNEFGTDEFMKWCEAVGTEPYLCLNFGTGTLDEGKHYLDKSCV